MKNTCMAKPLFKIYNYKYPSQKFNHTIHINGLSIAYFKFYKITQFHSHDKINVRKTTLMHKHNSNITICL